MASWKKVLVSGSNIEVNDILSTGNITASVVPTLDNDFNVLTIDPNTGGITQIVQSNIAGTNPLITIEGENAGTESFDSITAGDAHLHFVVADSSGIVPTDTGNSYNGFAWDVNDSFATAGTASIKLLTPQDLQTSAKPKFASITASSEIVHDGDGDTKIRFITDEIRFHAGGIQMLSLDEDTQSSVTVNTGGVDVDFRVEGDTDTHLLFTDVGEDKVAIGTSTVNANSLLTVDGTIHTTGITASLLPINTTSAHVIVSGANGLEKRDIQPLIDSSVAALTGSITASIIGTANEIIVDTNSDGDTQIGIVDNAIIGGGLTVQGDISASNIHAAGNITGSNLRVENDIAIGGNLFSFTGLSLIENISANFTGSNLFGSGSHPGANDLAGGGTAHQFTGSVGITGSALTITDGSLTLNAGSVTANSGTGSFGYLTANEISSSGHLYAELPNDTTPINDGVVVYDTATGQLLYTASSAVGVTEYPDLNNIPVNIVSSSTFSSNNQGGVTASINDVNSSFDVGLTIADSPQFTNLLLTGNAAIVGSASISRNLIVNGDISGSGALFASLSLDDTTTYRTVVYDPSTGKFFHTGSYGGSGGGLTSYTALDNVPENILSSSAFSSNGQGEITASINGVTSSFDVGLLPTDNVNFATVTTTGDVSVGGNATVLGNLTVEGTTTTINTTNLSIEDRFILLASGAQDDTSAGIMVSRATNGNGTALFWDQNTDMWSIDLSGADPDASTYGTATGDLKIVTVFQDTSLPSQPGIADEAYGNSTDNARGQLFVDTTNDDLYVYL